MSRMPLFEKIPDALQVMTGAVLISFSGVYVKLSQTGPTASGFYRVFFGGIILLLISLISKQPSVKSLKAGFLFFPAGFFFALDLFTWHKSIHYTGPGLATILANFQVFFLAFIGIIFMGERVNLKLILTIPIAVLGLFMVVGIEWDILDADYKKGVLLGLATAICYTGYILTLRKLQSLDDSPSPIFTLAMVSFITAIILAGFAWLQGEPLRIPDLESAFYLILYAAFSQVLGWLFIINGLASIRTSMAGLLLLLQPSLAFVWDILFFEKVTTAASLTGTLITLGAIYLGSTSRAESDS
ncbi:MAG: DMT family transporter [Desulfobacteraceae bacterium]|nr:MAG: DMT family transporter [Desulfobacteraceae bacterium]